MATLPLFALLNIGFLMMLCKKIALENSVAETAFFISLNDGFEIRWFTPEIEADWLEAR